MRTVIMLLPMLLLAQDESKLDELIKKLSDTSIDLREDATRELVKIGQPAIAALEKAAASDDPDLRDRAGLAIRRIRARLRAVELGLEKLIPADLRKRMPDLLERSATDDPAEKVKLLEDLQSAVENGTLREIDLAWTGALLRGPVNAKVRTTIYKHAKRWWYNDADTALRDAGKKILIEMGEEFLKDWPRILARIADTPNEGTVFDAEMMNSNRGGTEEGQVTEAAIAELAKLGLMEAVPILVEVASDSGADTVARKAAIQAVGAMRRKK